MERRVIHTRAPLRLGLGGGGTDLSPYCDSYGGAVLNATIDLYAYAFVESSDVTVFRAIDLDLEVVLDSLDQETSETLALHHHSYRWAVENYNDGEPFNCQISTFCEAPPGSGLGSSSTMVVAILGAFAAFLGKTISDYSLARDAYHVERVLAGLSGGRQDQYAAAFGGFNFMEFLPNDRTIVNPLRVRRAVISELEASMILYYTGVSRSSAAIIDQQQSNLREGSATSTEAMHQLKQDAFDMKEFLLKGDIPAIAEVLNRSWVAKQQTASGITTPSIERAIAAATEHGAVAAKVSGAGGGGFLTFLCPPERRLHVRKALERETGEVLSFSFTKLGLESWQPR